jgi:colicin import membrane protein
MKSGILEVPVSATVYYEPYKLPAGILALVVHSVFFSLLYFGINWNRQAFSQPTMSVVLWQSLPEEAVAPPVSPKVEEIVPPPQEKKAEPDIVIPENKKAVVKPVEARPEKKKQKPVEKVKPNNSKQEIARQDARIAKEQAAREQAERVRQAEQAASEQAARARQAELAAAQGKVVDEYQAKIRAKIRKNIVEPPNVSPDARAEFSVTLLPGGAVLPPRLVKSSGNEAYDNAVERAILKSDPLPLPPDVQLFNRFRELDLVFIPENRTN